MIEPRNPTHGSRRFGAAQGFFLALLIALTLSPPPPIVAQQPAVDAQLAARVAAILEATPLIDGHNDLASELVSRTGGHPDRIDLGGDTGALAEPLHTDIPRLRRGMVGAQFFAAYVSPKLDGLKQVVSLLQEIDAITWMAAAHPDHLALARSADDIMRIHRSGRIACLVGIEGGHAIANSLPVLRQAYACGARSMTLTHSATTDWADSATDQPRHGGLSPFGREVVREMNRLGMLVDLSHVSDDAMQDALEVSASPVIFSHSSARALTNHTRNVPDEILRLTAAQGGLVMVTFVPSFTSEEVRLWYAARGQEKDRLAGSPGDDEKAIEKALAHWEESNPRPHATLQQVADNVDHVRKVTGIDHVGIGSDFDGISSTPVGLEDVSTFPALLAELLRRGYSDADVAKVAGGNLLRVLRRGEETAIRLQRERPGSFATIEELDVSDATATGTPTPATTP